MITKQDLLDYDVEEFEGQEATDLMQSMYWSSVLRRFKALSLEECMSGKERGYSLQLRARRLSWTKTSEVQLWFSLAEVEHLKITIGKGVYSGTIDIIITLAHSTVQLRRDPDTGILFGIIGGVFNAIFFKTEHVWVHM